MPGPSWWCGWLSGYLGEPWGWDGASWTRLAGAANTTDEAPVCGTLDAANLPGGRARTSGVVDSTGASWLFGGDSPAGSRRDPWRYQQ